MGAGTEDEDVEEGFDPSQGFAQAGAEAVGQANLRGVVADGVEARALATGRRRAIVSPVRTAQTARLRDRVKIPTGGESPRVWPQGRAEAVEFRNRL